MSKETKSDKPAAAPPAWSLLESATWSPAQAGDKVEGTLGSPEMGPFGEQHTVKAEDGTIVLPHLTPLRALSRVPIGSLVRITYKGEKVSKAGNTYKDCSIETATPSGGGAA